MATPNFTGKPKSEFEITSDSGSITQAKLVQPDAPNKILKSTARSIHIDSLPPGYSTIWVAYIPPVGPPDINLALGTVISGTVTASVPAGTLDYQQPFDTIILLGA